MTRPASLLSNTHALNIRIIPAIAICGIRLTNGKVLFKSSPIALSGSRELMAIDYDGIVTQGLAAQNLIRSRRGPAGGTFVNRPARDEVRLTVANAASLLVSMGEFSLQDIAEARPALELIYGRIPLPSVEP